MQIKRIKSLITSQEGESQIQAMTWSSNNMKFAVCVAERTIILFDENGEQRDKFSTKPCDPKYGKNSFIVKALAFSPDSSMLAVAQTDNIVFVYKIGIDWGDKKSIVAKLVQNSAITCMIWLEDSQIIFGLSDGKIRSGSVKRNKSSTLYTAEHYTVSLTTNPSGKAILSGHADGSLVRYIFNDEGTGETQGLLCRHSCPPYSIAWTPFGIFVGGCDKRIIVYTKDGRTLQQFDYTKDPSEKEFTVGVCSPSGQTAVIGSYNRLRIYNWSPRKGLFEEAQSKDIKNFYTISSLAWKKDGSKLCVGNLTGCVDIFDCSLKKKLYKGKFEMTYVGLSQVLIRNKTTSQQIDLKSHYGYEVFEVKILGKDRYVIAHTTDTLMIGDINSGRLSEIPWRSVSSNEEKFYFENESVCMIFAGGELTLVEYGASDALASVRTEFMNPHLISVRLNERKQNGIADNKKIAYLVDLKTISIIDLLNGSSVGQVQHDLKVDWLELNETAKFLLFRDKKMRLHLYNTETQERNCVLNFCTYVQWVPDSDVIVAQNRGNLCIWYNIEAYEKVTMVAIKGDIQEVKKENNKTLVVINEGVNTVNYELDSSLIEFATAVDDGDLERAVDYLESVAVTEETEAMWKTLAKISVENKKLHIAERCYAALGDVAKVRFLKETNKIAIAASRDNEDDGSEYFEVKARLAELDKNFKQAEFIYLENNQLDLAIEMYQGLYRWDEAIELAEKKNHRNLDDLKLTYYKYLTETDQLEQAGAVKEKEGDLTGAVTLYLKANLPVRAARVVTSNQELMHNQELINKIAATLIKLDFYESAGDLFEKISDDRKALECYKTGRVYRKAVDLARLSAPGEVVKLENDWGDHLYSQKMYDAAINHYIEAGEFFKAVDSAINSRQWKKAVDILQTQNSEAAVPFYKKIADHFASVQEYEQAERYYIKANAPKDCIEMYNRSGKWEQAFKIATSCLSKKEVASLYLNQAKLLEEQGKYKEAEKLYVTINEVDSAIQMFKRIKNYDAMLKLIKEYHPEVLTDTYLHLAKEIESTGNMKLAENYYINANDWKSVVNMYRRGDMWEEAFRVGKANGGPVAAKQIAYLWAKTLNSESAIKMLSKYGLLEQVIDHAAENCAFDFAFDLAKTTMKDKLPQISFKYATYLEDEGRFEEAEREFLKAKKPREAVLMYVHVKDWNNAQRIAENYDQSLISDVLIGQAKLAFEEKNYQKAEAFLLRAQRPELAIKLYKDNGLWQDAFRVCREYVPNKLDLLREEYDNTVSDKSSFGVEGLLEQAAKWESQGEYEKAVDGYIRIQTSQTIDKEAVIRLYMKAFELSNKFLGEVRTQQVVQEIAPRLIDFKRAAQAAELYFKVDMYKECVDAFISAEDWVKAKKVAEQLDKSLISYVEEQYKRSLQQKGDVKSLAGVDVFAALDIYASKGQWEECFREAEKQNEIVLHKYVAQYAVMLLQKGKSDVALECYKKYGAPAIQQNYNIYQKLALDTLKLDSTESADNYKSWANLRDVLYNLTQNISKSQDKDSNEHKLFEKLFLVSHYNAMRAACSNNDQLQEIATKLSISLLRHSDIIPADKAFYEAGIMCQKAKWDSMGFMFLNRYIDLADAIDDNGDFNDNFDFSKTDIPEDVHLPRTKHLSKEKHEEIKGWIISMSMSGQIDMKLKMDERGVYEASLIVPNTNTKCLPCVVTGYPVLYNKIEFKANLAANKEDWNKFLMISKMSRTDELADCLKFLGLWCNTNPNPNYSFN